MEAGVNHHRHRDGQAHERVGEQRQPQPQTADTTDVPSSEKPKAIVFVTCMCDVPRTAKKKKKITGGKRWVNYGVSMHIHTYIHMQEKQGSKFTSGEAASATQTLLIELVHPKSCPLPRATFKTAAVSVHKPC